MTLEPDLLRHFAKGFAVAVALSAFFGFLLTTLDQVPAHEIENERERGRGVGRLRGYKVAYNEGVQEGGSQALADLPILVVSGDPERAYRIAYDYSWNEAIDLALARARPRKLTPLAAFDEWEALKR